LITRFDLYPEWRQRVPPEVVIDRMRRDLRIEFKGAEPAVGQSATVAFTLSYWGKDPVKVAGVANALAAFYVQGRPWLRARLARLEQELLERRSRFTERHPDVIQAKAEIAALRRQLAAAHDGEPAWAPGSPAPPAVDTMSGGDRHAERAEQRGGQFRILDPAIPSQQPVLPDRARIVLAGPALKALPPRQRRAHGPGPARRPSGETRCHRGSSAGFAGAISGLLASDARGPARGRPAARIFRPLASDGGAPAPRRPAAR